MKEDLTQVNPKLHEWLGIVNAMPSNDTVSQRGRNVNPENDGRLSLPKLPD